MIRSARSFGCSAVQERPANAGLAVELQAPVLGQLGDDGCRFIVSADDNLAIIRSGEKFHQRRERAALGSMVKRALKPYASAA